YAHETGRAGRYTAETLRIEKADHSHGSRRHAACIRGGADTETMDNLVASNTATTTAFAVDHALPIGAILNGTYRIVRPLAEGGCGEVYVGEHLRLPGELAVKVLRRSLIDDAESLTRFRSEAEITSAMRHPHVVQVFDFNVTEDGVPYLVMELLDGQL